MKTPKGVSQWKEEGIKYGYWDYFIAEERSKVIETVKQMKASEDYLDKCLKISKECYDREFYVNKALDCFLGKLNQSK